MTVTTLAEAVSAFGTLTKAKLSNKAVSGAPEDQLRAPLETLLIQLAEISGLIPGAVSLVGETSLAHLGTRPDYAVTVTNALVGFIEVKAPGKGADPRRFSDPHDKKQWEKLSSLPNLIYTDGNSFSLWQDGELQGEVVHLKGDIATAGASLSAPPSLLPLISGFLQWKPIPPRTAKQLAGVSARLCRFLRDEVTEDLQRSNSALEELAKEWRSLLFPQASDEEFADGYAQAVTFGLLVARARDISLAGGIDHAALELRKSSSLISTALRLLTDDPENREALKTSLDTLTRVLEEVDWTALTKDKPEAWLYFYEDFLEVYDNDLRKRTGSYYTPPEVVDAMVSLVDEALRDPALFGRPLGLASADVTIADPAVGTGTFLLGVLRRMAATIEDDQGAGGVPAAIAAASKRLIGFELQFGPFAVAQLRLVAEMQELLEKEEKKEKKRGKAPPLRLFITDTLGNPYAAQEQFPTMLAAIGESRKEANAIKRSEPITVVIGNPPYKENARGRGGWVEEGTEGRAAPMDRWTPPVEWGASAHTKHLKNLYVYFWRWATWKVFGSGVAESTGEEEKDRAGIVCFITVSGFLNGPGFQKMRDDLRRDCSDIWVIDCSPEGHQPEVASRIFQGVQQPVCIVLAARPKDKNREMPAHLHFASLPEGRREEKFSALQALSLADASGWMEGPNDWRGPFLPDYRGEWGAYPALESFFVYSGSGVMPGRTWIIAPDSEALEKRWEALVSAGSYEKKQELFYPHLRNGKPGDKHVGKVVSKHLSGHPAHVGTVADDNSSGVPPTRYAFRTFDRQWIIPDARLINQPNPTLWTVYSKAQTYLTAVGDVSPSSGPAISFTGLLPDLHHYHGRGGRVYPLWRDAKVTEPNVKPALTDHLASVYGIAVSPEDMLAYLAALMAHPAFVVRFADDLVRPGLRVPLTADRALFEEAVELGREIVWLHCYGERFTDPAKGRPAGAPRLPKGEGPTIPAGGAIPGDPEPLPEDMSYDVATRRLSIGLGYIENVPKEVWEYEVSGKNVLRHWFSYRKRDRSRPVMGDRRPPSPLEKIQPGHWLAEYTSDLLDLLHVLGRLVRLESKQADLLDRICEGPLLSADELEAAGAFALPKTAAKKGKGKSSTTQDDLFNA